MNELVGDALLVFAVAVATIVIAWAYDCLRGEDSRTTKRRRELTLEARREVEATTARLRARRVAHDEVSELLLNAEANDRAARIAAAETTISRQVAETRIRRGRADSLARDMASAARLATEISTRSATETIEAAAARQREVIDRFGADMTRMGDEAAAAFVTLGANMSRMTVPLEEASEALRRFGVATGGIVRSPRSSRVPINVGDWVNTDMSWTSMTSGDGPDEPDANGAVSPSSAMRRAVRHLAATHEIDVDVVYERGTKSKPAEQPLILRPGPRAIRVRDTE